MERILRHVPTLPRLRLLLLLDLVEIDDRLFDLITGDARVMPHLHLSLQAGDDMILKRMKRRHSRAQAIATVERLKAKRPDIAIGADLIAGFPTETDEMAANSLALIDECDIVMGHIFPYSPRAGTPAAKMPQVKGDAIKARARLLREATARRRANWLEALVGTEQRVLVERADGRGHAENFAEVHLPAGQPIGRVVPARITAFSQDMLIGEPRERTVNDTNERAVRWHERLFGGFSKTSGRLSDNLGGLFGKAQLDAATLDEIEEALIASDLGPATAGRIRERLAAERFPLGLNEHALREVIAREVAAVLAPWRSRWRSTPSRVRR